MQNQYIIPIFVPHLGCPNDCVFCNQRSISGQKKQVTGAEVKQTIKEYLENLLSSLELSKNIVSFS